MDAATDLMMLANLALAPHDIIANLRRDMVDGARSQTTQDANPRAHHNEAALQVEQAALEAALEAEQAALEAERAAVEAERAAVEATGAADSAWRAHEAHEAQEVQAAQESQEVQVAQAAQGVWIVQAAQAAQAAQDSQDTPQAWAARKTGRTTEDDALHHDAGYGQAATQFETYGDMMLLTCPKNEMCQAIGFSPVQTDMTLILLKTDGSHETIKFKQPTIDIQLRQILFAQAFASTGETMRDHVTVRHMHNGVPVRRQIHFGHVGYDIVNLGTNDGNGVSLCLARIVEVVAAPDGLAVAPMSFLPVNEAVTSHLGFGDVVHGPAVLLRMKISQSMGTTLVYHTCTCVCSRSACVNFS